MKKTMHNYFSDVHRYIRHKIFETIDLMGKTDFRIPQQQVLLKEKINQILEFLTMHGTFEDTILHKLLEDKGSTVHKKIEADHKSHAKIFNELKQDLDRVISSTNPEEQVILGYKFYLEYTKFVSNNLRHLYEEETIIMPELWKLYANEELRNVTLKGYREMTTDQLKEMVQTLFPHVSPIERESQLIDIKTAVPEKFHEIWALISPTIESQERSKLSQALLG